MAAHWTYASCTPVDGLEQGDILTPSQGLRDIFKRVLPHFQDQKYLGFLVATQSCDLVRRDAEPKASYVTLAAIRPLSQVIRKIVSQVAVPIGENVFRVSARAEARRLLERLFNQNEQALGLFFLSTDPEAGIAEPAVAFLRVAVALRAEHYDELRAARVGRLTPEFRAKLGWLIGNLYVRPATPDWHDQLGGTAKMGEMIAQQLSELRWLDDELVDSATAAGVDVATMPEHQLELLRPPSRLERALDEIVAQLKKIAPNFPAEESTKFRNRLKNDGKFSKLFK